MTKANAAATLIDWETYRKQQGATCYDELLGAGGRPRRLAQPLFRHLQKLGRDGIGQIQRRAESTIGALGITFTVYQEEGGLGALDRSWPLDIIPRIIDGADWLPVEKGLEQRLQALNMFLDDIYHNGRILKDGVVPEALVKGSARYCPQCRGASPAHGVWAHVCGSDLVRDPKGRFRVLEDNLCVPSGVSYMLENRAVMLNVATELFADGDIAPVGDYPRQLYRTLATLAPRADPEPQIVVLTPGALNAAYYEHAFLANQMGAILAEPQDLVALDERIYLRTIRGLERVDVIYRRVDDAFLDPTVFRHDSLLGVPGLIEAWRRGSVALANAPDCGVADDKIVYAYVPKIIRYYLDQEPLLENVPTWPLHDDATRARTRPPEALRVQDRRRPRHRVRSQRLGQGAGPGRRQDRRAATPLHRPEPGGAVDGADDQRPLAGAPAAGPAPVRAAGRPGLGDRRRPDPRRPELPVVPGELLAGRRQGHLGDPAARRAARRARVKPLLSRQARQLFWTGRYMERAEGVVRAMSAWHLLVRHPQGLEREDWRHLLDGLGQADGFAAGYDNEPNVIRHLVSKRANRASVSTIIEALRANMRALRDLLPEEAWQCTSRQQALLGELVSSVGRRRGAMDAFIRHGRAGTEAFQATMRREEAFAFWKMGRLLESVDGTCRVLAAGLAALGDDAAEEPSSDDLVWTHTLNALGLLSAYANYSRRPIQTATVIDFMIADALLPRSALCCLQSVRNSLESLPNNTEALRRITRPLRAVAAGPPSRHKAPARWLGRLGAQAQEIAQTLSKTYFPDWS